MFQSIARSVFTVLCLTFSFVAYGDYKDRAEFDAYDAVAKDFQAKNHAKAITDLDFWSKAYPESDFRNDRQLLYVLAYFALNQPAKVIEAASPLLSGEARSTLTKPTDVLQLYYSVAASIRRIPDPTEGQFSAAAKAAHGLLAFDAVPPGVTADAWAKNQADFQKVARAALLYAAIVPVERALKSNDCTTAEGAAMKTIHDFPESAQAAWYVGAAAMCSYKLHPEKVSLALFEFARAATVDPETGMVDGTWQRSTVLPYLEKLYTQYHGADAAGLAELKRIAVRTSVPPADFSIPSAAEIVRTRQEAFERDNPEVALWINIKRALVAGDGLQYFASGLKDTALPRMLGVVMGAKPECKPMELLVAIRTPESGQELKAEITLRLSRALSGKPVTGSEIRWEGIPVEFTSEPFMVVMETDAERIEGLKTETCASAPGARAKGKRH